MGESDKSQKAFVCPIARRYTWGRTCVTIIFFAPWPRWLGYFRTATDSVFDGGAAYFVEMVKKVDAMNANYWYDSNRTVADALIETLYLTKFDRTRLPFRLI
jgi:hypothetical protein